MMNGDVCDLQMYVLSFHGQKDGHFGNLGPRFCLREINLAMKKLTICTIVSCFKGNAEFYINDTFGHTSPGTKQMSGAPRS